MKRIDLGHGAVAFEPNAPKDRIDTVTEDFFTRNNLSEDASRLYRQFQSTVQGQAAAGLDLEALANGLGDLKRR